MEKEPTTAKETEEEVARLKKLARKTHNVKLRQLYTHKLHKTSGLKLCTISKIPSAWDFALWTNGAVII